MDPSFSIDLTSIGGIVAATYLVVEFLKHALANMPGANRVPVWTYSLLAACGLTYFAHDVLHVLPGDLRELLAQAVMASLLASGALEQVRAIRKPLSASTAARSITDRRRPRGVYLIPILLAIGPSAGCAKAMPPLLTAEKSVRGTIVTVSATVEPLVCSAEARAILGAAPCLQLLDALDPATDMAIAYNRALRSGKVPNIVQMVAAVDKLAAAVRAVVPASAAKDSALTELQMARARAEGGK